MTTLLNTTSRSEAKVFLTDYASYNNGTQFEFGHWLDLSDFDSAEDLNEYISDHFKNADKKSPLDNYGSKREEIMITDYEGFPAELYSECMNFEALYIYFDLADESTFDNEVINAFADLGNYKITDSEDFFNALDESYNGQYDSDEDFAQELADALGVEISTSWPHNCIDWTRAARDLMYDYSESNGHYFRNI